MMADLSARLEATIGSTYRIERELGAGGMATVYLAQDIRHHRKVAIKVLHAELSAVLGSERFLKEIELTANLQHPHILPLFDSGSADGLLYYVMPCVDGETLRGRLERERQLPILDSVRIASEVADALEYAHRNGVIHRDIKPENILLQDGHALVADFGIALAVQQAGGTRMTQTGLSLGTPSYMSPEQAMGERVMDARSDIYALGAVTYEMLIGEPPFTGPSVQAIVARLLTEEPRSLDVQRKAVPEHVGAAVQRALEKLPADRFSTAAEFAAAMRDDHQVSSTRMSAQRRRGAQPDGPRSWLRRSAAPAAWLALLAVGAAAGWTSARRAPAAAAGNDLPTVTSILAPAGGTFGEQRSLALSPDGRRLAFVFAAGDGSRMLWLRRLDRLDAEPIAGSTGADAPFWSPDGRSLGYFAAGYLMVLDENGESRRLCPASGATGGSWSAKGVILFGHRDGISTVPADGGECARIVPPGAWPAPTAVFLPDGNRFLYSRGRELDMIAAKLNGDSITTLPVRSTTFAVAAPGYLVVPSRTDVRGLDAQRINLSTLKLEGPVVRVASNVRSSAGVHTFALSSSDALAFLPGVDDRPYFVYDANGLLRDTVRVGSTWTLAVRPRVAGPPVVAVAGNRVGIWLYDLDANRATRLLVRDPAFATAGMGYGTTYPVFNADGSHLAFAFMAPTRCRIVDRNLATGADRVVVQETVSATYLCPLPLGWSANGQKLLVRRDTVLQVMSLDGTSAVQSIIRLGRIWEGSFSPDGRSVAYSSDETGRAEVYVQELLAGSPVRMSLEGGRWPVWSRAGRLVTFVTPDGRVQEVDIGAAPGKAGGTPRTRFSVPTWRRNTFDDGGTGFAMVGDGERYLLRQSPTGLAVAYVQRWPALFRRPDSSGRAAARP